MDDKDLGLCKVIVIWLMVIDMSNMLFFIILLEVFRIQIQVVMLSLIEICFSVCVFYGNCLYFNVEIVELILRDWK